MCRKNPIPIFFLILGSFLQSCTPLKNSSAGFLFSSQGSYYCGAHGVATKQNESEAEKDVTSIRCYKDLWVLKGREINFVRTLYHSKKCEVAIGEVHFTSPLELTDEQNTTISHTRCSFIKENADWLGEENGKCMLHSVPLNEPVSLTPLYSCARSLPKFCLRSDLPIALTFTQDQLKMSAQGIESETCSRQQK